MKLHSVNLDQIQWEHDVAEALDVATETIPAYQDATRVHAQIGPDGPESVPLLDPVWSPAPARVVKRVRWGVMFWLAVAAYAGGFAQAVLLTGRF